MKRVQGVLVVREDQRSVQAKALKSRLTDELVRAVRGVWSSLPSQEQTWVPGTVLESAVHPHGVAGGWSH